MCLEQWAVCSWCEAKAEGAKQGGGARRALTAFGRTTLPELGVLHLWKDADIPMGCSAMPSGTFVQTQGEFLVN